MKSVSALIVSAALLIGSDPRFIQPEELTVHEWGTFTSVAGEDGTAIEWNTLGCKSDLPGFVKDSAYRNGKATLRGTVRMETPVLYFYSPHELTSNVKVEFPHGARLTKLQRAT